MNRMIARILGGCLAACLCLGLSPLSAADAIGPLQVIQAVSVRLKQVLEQDHQQLVDDPTFVYRMADEIFLPHVDMSRVSSLVLGRNWRKTTPRQKDAFTREFKRLLVRTYATAMRELGNWEVRFQPRRTRPDERHALVQSQILRPGAQPLAVDYQLHRSKGNWLAYDVKIEGISLVTNYRSSFRRLVRQKGIDGLIEELAAMNASKDPEKSGRVAANSNH